MQFRKLLLFTAVLALGLSACATGTAVTSGEQLNIQFQIENNLQGIQGVSVYLVTETGQRRSLGPVESNRTGTYARALRANTYYLLATRVGQSDVVSERFRLDTDAMTVIWALGQNQITLRQH